MQHLHAVVHGSVPGYSCCGYCICAQCNYFTDAHPRECYRVIVNSVVQQIHETRDESRVMFCSTGPRHAKLHVR